MNRRISLSHCVQKTSLFGKKINSFGIRQFRKFSNFDIISDNPGKKHLRHILPKLSKTCHKPKKIPPCPPKLMLSVGGFVDRCFRGMNNIVRWEKGGGCFQT